MPPTASAGSPRTRPPATRCSSPSLPVPHLASPRRKPPSSVTPPSTPGAPHDGFRHTVEHSVYLAEDARGRGIGTALMRELIAAARAAGKHVMVAAISADNPSSIAFHSRLGFRTVGTFTEVGTKFGRLLDLVVMQYVLVSNPRRARAVVSGENEKP